MVPVGRAVRDTHLCRLRLVDPSVEVHLCIHKVVYRVIQNFTAGSACGEGQGRRGEWWAKPSQLLPASEQAIRSRLT
jgi:hypothetical protein